MDHMQLVIVFATGIGPLGEFITGLATLVLAVTAAVTVIAARSSFFSQAREARGRWLADLYTRFTTQPSFQSIRQQLYNKTQSELNGALVHAHMREAQKSEQPLSHEEQKLLVELDDYLDFFSLIWHLISNDQLDQGDAYNLFSWYALDPFEVEAVESEIARNYPSVVKLRTMFEDIKAKEQASPIAESPSTAHPPN